MTATNFPTGAFIFVNAIDVASMSGYASNTTPTETNRPWTGGGLSRVCESNPCEGKDTTMKHYTPKQWLAIGLAGALWIVETAFLLDAAGWAITPSVAAIPVATAALAYLPLALDEARGGITRFAMLLAAVFLGAHVVGSVIERTGEALDTKIAKAGATGEARALLQQELQRAQMQLGLAQNAARDACRTRAWSDNCKNHTGREKAYQARVDQLTAELVDAPVAPPADPVATRLAAFSFGFVAPATASLWRPVLLPFGCLLGIWSLLGFGFRRHDVTPIPVQAITEGERITDAEIEELRRLLKANKVMSNQELADAMGVVKSEAHRRVTKAVDAGVVSKTRNGREVAITLN